MNPLLLECYDFLNAGGFPFAFCGGYAIELFLNKPVRSHGDIDISAFWEDRDTIIRYMQSKDWTVYEACGGGVVHLINNIDKQLYIKRNIFCVKDGCTFFHTEPIGEDRFQCTIDHIEQTQLDYIEFLFNTCNDKGFIYARNNDIFRTPDKAILENDNIPYLSPELVLLYKSTDITRDGYQLDFDVTVWHLTEECRLWLTEALNIMYPDGHHWLDLLKRGQYFSQLDKLCRALRLGGLIASPEPISGGLLHKMFRVETELDTYAVKVLNPKIMLRPTAMQNYIDSENIATIAAKNIPAAPAKKFGGKAVQEIDGNYYLIFDYLYGKNLFGNDIHTSHCEQIGYILAKIHTTDFSELGLSDTYTADEPVPDWSFYLQKGEEMNAVWVNLMRDNINNLYEWSNRLSRSAKALSKNTVITHGDLEPKNVIWENNTPTLIDWEAAGFINPMNDLVETAVYWSKDSSGSMDKAKFLSLIKGYQKVIPCLEADWKVVLDKGFSGMLGWLEYSLKRSLWIECADDDENRMGTEHVTGTINSILQYARSIGQLKEWLKEV